MALPTEQEQEFEEAGIEKNKRPTWLKAVFIIISTVATTSITLNFYQLRQAQSRSDMMAEYERRHSAEIQQLQNNHALEMSKVTNQVNGVLLQILKQYTSISIKVDTTLKSQ